MVMKTKWTKDAEDWKENSAHVYHLVLTHCHPELEAEIRNHLKWGGAKSPQNGINLLIMIRDVIHGKRETK